MSVTLFRFLFYQKYFKEAAKNMGIPLSDFYLPSLRKEERKKPSEVQENTRFKTVNSKYIKTILSSEIFKKDFENYLDNMFVQEYKNERDQKLTYLTSNMKTMKKLIQSFKLPWTRSEIIQARDYFKEIVLKNV
jgi:hypothetical protein